MLGRMRLQGVCTTQFAVQGDAHASRVRWGFAATHRGDVSEQVTSAKGRACHRVGRVLIDIFFLKLA